MKKRLFFLLAFIFSLMPILGQETSKHFTFPITPKDSKWSEYKTTAERIRVLQIPKELLTSIPTEELLDICLDYPYLGDFLAFNDFRDGFKCVTGRFNGFRELFCREDLAKVLPSKISACQELKESYSGKAVPMDLQVKITALDLLATEDIVLNKLDKSTKSQIINGIKGRASSVTDPLFVNVNNSLLSYLGGGKKHSYEPGNIKGQPVNIYTPNGTLITTAYIPFEEEMSDSSKNKSWEYWHSLHPQIKLKEKASLKYNCHAYAWHMHPDIREDNKVWLENDSPKIVVPNYWEDGSYIRVPEAISTHVYYEKGYHSAIRETSDLYLSKWREGPLVYHAPEDTPFGKPKEYFRIAPKIEGPDIVLKETTFSIENMPPSSTIEWSVSNGNIVISSGQGTTAVSIKNISNGEATITATIKYNGNKIATLYKDILTKPSSIGTNINFYTPKGVIGYWVSKLSGNTFTIKDDSSECFDRIEAELYSMDHFEPSELIESWSDISTKGARIHGRKPGMYLFRLRGVYKSEYSDWLEREVEMLDYLSLNFLLDYESATETLNLTFIEPDTENTQRTTAKMHSTTKDVYKIELWNEQKSTKVGNYQTTQTYYQISLVGMPSGVYIARITVNGNTYSKKFVKN